MKIGCGQKVAFYIFYCNQCTQSPFPCNINLRQSFRCGFICFIYGAVQFFNVNFNTSVCPFCLVQ